MNQSHDDRHDSDFDFNALLHPASAFAHPVDVLNDPDLTRHEKRAILSSWASDACAVESAPTLRRPPGAPAPVTFDDIVDALRRLDDDDPPEPPRPRPLRMRLRSGWRQPDRDGEGQGGGASL